MTIRDGEKGIVVWCHVCQKDGQQRIIEHLKQQGLWEEKKKAEKADKDKPARIVETYPYRRADGTLAYQAVRYEPKTFRQRKPDGRGGWIWGAAPPAERVLYRLPEVLEAVKAGRTVFVVEGEKDVNNGVAKLGLCFTCNVQGAGKWLPQYTAALKGARVVIIADKDDAGRKHADKVAVELYAAGIKCKIIELPGAAVKDLTDWLNAGGTAEQLKEILASVPEYSPAAATVEVPAMAPSAVASIMPLTTFWVDTDMANAERLIHRHGADFRYMPERGFAVWQKDIWVPDEEGLYVQELAKTTAKDIRAEVSMAEHDVRVALEKHAHKSQEGKKLREMMRLAKSAPEVMASINDFDRDPLVINLANGRFDMRNDRLEPHKREHLCMKISRVNYNPKAKCHKWLGFLYQIMNGDESKVQFLKRFGGYCLTGLTNEQMFLQARGTGANGKSVWVEVLRLMLGDYAAVTQPETFTQQRPGAIRNDIAALVGARFVVASELSKGARLDVGLIKQLTGGDMVSARFMRKEFFTFKPQCKIVMTSNYLPQAPVDDKAFWRRYRVINFPIIIPEGERIPNLAAQLWEEEKEGILAWHLEGTQEMLQDGLRTPEAVETETKEARKDLDSFGMFLDEHFTVYEPDQPGASEVSTEIEQIYKVYEKWCDETGHHKMSRKAVGLTLTDRGFEKHKHPVTQRTCYRRLELLHPVVD